MQVQQSMPMTEFRKVAKYHSLTSASYDDRLGQIQITGRRWASPQDDHLGPSDDEIVVNIIHDSLVGWGEYKYLVQLVLDTESYSEPLGVYVAKPA